MDALVTELPRPRHFCFDPKLKFISLILDFCLSGDVRMGGSPLGLRCRDLHEPHRPGKLETRRHLRIRHQVSGHSFMLDFRLVIFIELS